MHDIAGHDVASLQFAIYADSTAARHKKPTSVQILPAHSMLQDYQSCLPEYKLTTIKLSVQCSVLKHTHCRVLLLAVNTASCALCRMSTDSIFNIAPASLTLGAVLARGSPGITLYKADLLLGQRTLQVQLATVFSVCLLSASLSFTPSTSVTTCLLPTGGCEEAQHKWGPT
jgi:hypothetical protein